MTIRATHRTAGPPTSDQTLAAYFSRAGLCAPALNPEAVGGGGRSLSDSRLVASGAACFPGEHELNGDIFKDKARRTSSVTAWEATRVLMEQVAPEHQRTLALVFDPTHTLKPMLRLLDNAAAKARLGPFRMLIDETPAMLVAFRHAQQVADEKVERRSPEEALLREARAAGIQYDELRKVRSELAVDGPVHDIEVAMTPEQLRLRRRERGLERTLETLVAATRQQAPLLSLYAFILSVEGTRKGEKALLQEAREQAEARASQAWEAWLDVRGRRTQVRGPVSFDPGEAPTDWMRPREPETESE